MLNIAIKQLYNNNNIGPSIMFVSVFTDHILKTDTNIMDGPPLGTTYKHYC